MKKCPVSTYPWFCRNVLVDTSQKNTADNTDSVSANLDERMCEAWCYFTLQLFISVNGDFDFVLVFNCSVLAS